MNISKYARWRRGNVKNLIKLQPFMRTECIVISREACLPTWNSLERWGLHSPSTHLKRWGRHETLLPTVHSYEYETRGKHIKNGNLQHSIWRHLPICMPESAVLNDFKETITEVKGDRPKWHQTTLSKINGPEAVIHYLSIRNVTEIIGKCLKSRHGSNMTLSKPNPRVLGRILLYYWKKITVLHRLRNVLLAWMIAIYWPDTVTRRWKTCNKYFWIQVGKHTVQLAGGKGRPGVWEFIEQPRASNCTGKAVTGNGKERSVFYRPPEHQIPQCHWKLGRTYSQWNTATETTFHRELDCPT